MNQFDKMIDEILGFAYNVNDLLADNADELIQKNGKIIDICEKYLDSKKQMDGFDV